MSLRVCTIGCGGIAQRYHGPSLARYAAGHPDVELAACCDLDPARAARFAEWFGFGRSCTDLEAMLDEEQPDAVTLLVPVHLTCELGCRVLRRGLPLLTEKPPGLTVAELDRLIAAADASGAPNQVAFNRRATPLVAELKRLLSGRTIQHLYLEFSRIRRADPEFSTTAIHGIDSTRHLAGCDYQQVRFCYHSLPAFGPTVVNILVSGSFVSGAHFQMAFTPMAGVVTERTTVQADDQTFYLELASGNGLDFPGRLRHYERGKLQLDVSGQDLSPGGEPMVLEGFYAENERFLDAIRAGERPEHDLRSTRQSVEVAEALRNRLHELRPEPTPVPRAVRS